VFTSTLSHDDTAHLTAACLALCPYPCGPIDSSGRAGLWRSGGPNTHTHLKAKQPAASCHEQVAMSKLQHHGVRLFWAAQAQAISLTTRPTLLSLHRSYTTPTIFGRCGQMLKYRLQPQQHLVFNNIYDRSKVVSRAAYSIELINQLHGGR